MVTGLKKQGANRGAALSFMIATPETGVDSIAVSWAMLDPLMTIVRPFAGFITAVTTGIAANFLDKKEKQIETDPQAFQTQNNSPEEVKPGST